MTNGDRLREMSDDELEKLLRSKIHACCRPNEYCYDRPTCEDCWMEWLKEEVAGDE